MAKVKVRVAGNNTQRPINSCETFEMGVKYSCGDGIEQNGKKAAECFEKIPEDSDYYVPAQIELGKLYYHGNGVKKDRKLAAEIFAKYSGDEYDEADYYLGKCYAKGYGVKKDILRALGLFLASAEQDNPDAQTELGLYYTDLKDYDTAFEWFEKAANYCNADGFYHLGKCYLHGCGTDKDIALAIENFIDAAEYGSKEAVRELRKLSSHGYDIVSMKEEHDKNRSEAFWSGIAELLDMSDVEDDE